MAIGAALKGTGLGLSEKVVCSGSVRSRWYTANSDLETNQSATELLQPHTINDEGFRWVEVPAGATRALLRIRTPLATGTVTTSPVVRVWGADGEPDADGDYSATVGDANHAEFMRLDSADVDAAGVTLTIPTTTTGNIDGTYIYGDVQSLDGTDLKGAHYVGVLVETAASVSGTVDIEAQIRFLN